VLAVARDPDEALVGATYGAGAGAAGGVLLVLIMLGMVSLLGRPPDSEEDEDSDASP
jgi:hypothetical protein